jgi:hypothetical protein
MIGSLLGRLLAIGGMALFGAGLGLALGAATGLLVPTARPADSFPLPHHVPKHAGAVTLRFAMVHDVIHERFARHGRDYYLKRNQLVREELKDRKPDARYFALVDDLAVGLEFAGEHDEAIRLMRDKLRQQQALGLKDRDLYSTHANLGTFLILGPFRKVVPGDAASKAVLREGLAHIHESIRVNPEAHFGREVWQAVIVEYMAASLDNPSVLLQYDMIGNRLGADIQPSRPFHPYANVGDTARYGLRDYVRQLETNADPSGFDPGRAERYRQLILKVGAEEGWADAVKSSHTKPVPFDEPCLGIIGMWRLGGGAHPYFSLALSETMLRVGQRYIAWCGYERTTAMASLYWPSPELQDGLVAHCRKRQALIEGQLPADEVARLRPRFEAELKYGQDYQQAYQEHESDQIRAGRLIEDPHFYDDFHAGRKPIASRPGPADEYPVTQARILGIYRPAPSWPLALLFAGLFAFLTAAVLRYRAAWRDLRR